MAWIRASSRGEETFGEIHQALPERPATFLRGIERAADNAVPGLLYPHM